LRTGNHAGHCGRQACNQQQDQRTELAENMHYSDETTSFRGE
jgi:hypothetical protein